MTKMRVIDCPICETPIPSVSSEEFEDVTKLCSANGVPVPILVCPFCAGVCKATLEGAELLTDRDKELMEEDEKLSKLLEKAVQCATDLSEGGKENISRLCRILNTMESSRNTVRAILKVDPIKPVVLPNELFIDSDGNIVTRSEDAN